MIKFTLNIIFFIAFILLITSCSKNKSKNNFYFDNNGTDEKSEFRILPPEELYGQLFFDVMSMNDLFGKNTTTISEHLFGDSKDFVDGAPKREIDSILNEYSDLENKSNPRIMRSFLEKTLISQLTAHHLRIHLK